MDCNAVLIKRTFCRKMPFYEYLVLNLSTVNDRRRGHNRMCNVKKVRWYGVIVDIIKYFLTQNIKSLREYQTSISISLGQYSKAL